MNINAKAKTATGITVLMVAAMFIAVAVVPAMVGASPSSVEGQARDMGRQKHKRPILGIWKDQNAVRMLALTKAQVQQIRDADFAAREKHLALKAQLDQLKLEMDKAFSLEVVDQKTILQLAKQTADARGKMFVQEVEAKLFLDTLLSPDQIQKLKQHGMDQKRKGVGCGKRQGAERHLTERI